MSESTVKTQGQVKWFNNKSWYGFISVKIGDETKGKGHGGEKSYLTGEEAFRNKVVVVDTDYMIIPNPYWESNDRSI